jgi:excisionase family DNA binding protein
MIHLHVSGCNLLLSLAATNASGFYLRRRNADTGFADNERGCGIVESVALDCLGLAITGKASKNEGRGTYSHREGRPRSVSAPEQRALAQTTIDLYLFHERGAEMDELLSVDEAARRLGCLSKYTIHALLSSCKLRRTKVGSRTMIRESELQRVIEDGGKSLSAQRHLAEVS